MVFSLSVSAKFWGGIRTCGALFTRPRLCRKVLPISMPSSSMKQWPVVLKAKLSSSVMLCVACTL